MNTESTNQESTIHKMRLKLVKLFHSKEMARLRWMSDNSTCEYYHHDGFMRCNDGKTIPNLRIWEMNCIEEVENNGNPEFRVKYTLEDSYLNPNNEEDTEWTYLKFIKAI